MRLWMLSTIVVVGWLVSVWTLAQTCRTAYVLGRSGINGVRWTLMTGDLIDDLLRLVSHTSIAVLLARSLIVGQVSSAPWTWRTWLLVAMIVSLALSSLNRWYTTRALIAQQTPDPILET